MTIDEAARTMREVFPGQLADCMALSGFNDRQFSKALGCEPSAVGSWRRGKCMPNGPSLYAMAETLGVTMELLVTGQERW